MYPQADFDIKADFSTQEHAFPAPNTQEHPYPAANTHEYLVPQPQGEEVNGEHIDDYGGGAEFDHPQPKRGMSNGCKISIIIAIISGVILLAVGIPLIVIFARARRHQQQFLPQPTPPAPPPAPCPPTPPPAPCPPAPPPAPCPPAPPTKPVCPEFKFRSDETFNWNPYPLFQKTESNMNGLRGDNPFATKEKMRRELQQRIDSRLLITETTYRQREVTEITMADSWINEDPLVREQCRSELGEKRQTKWNQKHLELKNKWAEKTKRWMKDFEDRINQWIKEISASKMPPKSKKSASAPSEGAETFLTKLEDPAQGFMRRLINSGKATSSSISKDQARSILGVQNSDSDSDVKKAIRNLRVAVASDKIEVATSDNVKYKNLKDLLDFLGWEYKIPIQFVAVIANSLFDRVTLF